MGVFCNAGLVVEADVELLHSSNDGVDRGTGAALRQFLRVAGRDGDAR